MVPCCNGSLQLSPTESTNAPLYSNTNTRRQKIQLHPRRIEHRSCGGMCYTQREGGNPSQVMWREWLAAICLMA